MIDFELNQWYEAHGTAYMMDEQDGNYLLIENPENPIILMEGNFGTIAHQLYGLTN